ncbi:hypothetical protein [Caldanaerobacter subterraneus]|uniref:Conjugative transposon protein TcpC n=1 Tax=Caldanaerobacter subterraneus TaxID=911092 RepID=A0A7Y2L6U4_9THEO|nr:hypothetical protein [Caldanaerobacter subterraneus]NNG66390.1 hypothetical protein [Caldanaerobacter subterraneus]
MLLIKDKKTGISLKIAIVLVLVSLIVILFGIFNPFSQNRILASSTNYNSDIKAVIESYVGYAVQNEWDKALSYLRGEAYLIVSTNLQNYKGENLKLKNIDIYNVVSGDNFAIADVKVVSQNENLLYNKYFRYYLYKEGNSWYIFSIGTPDKPIYGGKHNKYDFVGLIKDYFNAVQNKEFDKAFSLLTTPALEHGQNSMLSPESMNISSRFKNIQIKEVYNQGDNVFLRVSYTVDTTIGEKTVQKNMSYIFEVDNVNGKWLISNMKLVK